MTRNPTEIGLPRRVVALYLFFSLTAILSLAAGAFFTATSLVASRATEGTLARLGKLSAAVEMDLLRVGGKGLDRLLQTARVEGRFAHCAVVGPDGVYRAHTDSSLVGSVANEASGARLSWGSVLGTRYTEADGRVLCEYEAPLEVGGADAGRLRIAVVEPGWKGTLVELLRHAPLAILAPMACVIGGGLWLRRVTGPVAGVDSLLRRAARTPYGADPPIERADPTGLAAVGWNRLVEHIEGLRAELAARAVAAPAAPAATRAGDALASLAEGVAVTGPEGRVEFANRAIEALLGIDEPLEGADLDEVLGAIAPGRGEPLGGARASGRLIAEAPLLLAGGERTLRIERSPLVGPAGGAVWSVRDITQQKLAEAARDQFISTATHELRTPLANIRAYAETLTTCDFGDVEQQKEFLNTINTEATRLARFVDDLLSISSLEVGSIGALRENTDVRRLVEEAAEKVRPLMRAKNLTFDVALGEKLGEALLDKDKVASLLLNLLGNAAKYTPEGGTVTLAAARQTEQLVIDVRDTGVGIAEDECEKVFEKFYRSHDEAVRDEVGTGLGLPLAREIARLHRGDVTLKSKLGEGSVFTVTLPLE